MISHTSLDQLPVSRTRDYVRGLLVEHGALPRRNELAARYQTWSTEAIERLTDDASRDVVRRYLRWHHQRRMNAQEVVSHGTFLRSKQTVTVAIEFLNWLNKRGIELSQLTQAHLDAWQAEGPTTREIASRFLRWAIKSHLVSSDLTMTPHRRGTSPILSAAEQDEAVHQVVRTDELNTRDGAAAILVIVFGQHIEHVVQLTWHDVTLTDDQVTVQVGKSEITSHRR